MDNNIYPLFVLFQNEIFGNIYMNKIYVYKNRLYQIEFKKFQFDTAPYLLSLYVFYPICFYCSYPLIYSQSLLPDP